jgi:hypothetical protein
VHARSGGVCALCGYGGNGVDFDSWRQLTVEHLIGESQGGYRRQIVVDLATRFPELVTEQIEALASEIDCANTVTACSFCNSTTSRARCARSMSELIANCPDGLDEAVKAIALELGLVLGAKRADVRWKLASVRRAYDQRIAPSLLAARDAAHGRA